MRALMYQTNSHHEGYGVLEVQQQRGSVWLAQHELLG